MSEMRGLVFIFAKHALRSRLDRTHKFANAAKLGDDTLIGLVTDRGLSFAPWPSSEKEADQCTAVGASVWPSSASSPSACSLPAPRMPRPTQRNHRVLRRFERR